MALKGSIAGSQKLLRTACSAQEALARGVSAAARCLTRHAAWLGSLTLHSDLANHFRLARRRPKIRHDPIFG